MKKFSTLKTLALAAGMMLAGSQNVMAKADTPSFGNVVISKVFYSGSTRLNGATPKNYLLNLYIELYNNSAKEIELQGMYVALANSDGSTAAWTSADMTKDNVIKDAEGNEVSMEGKAVVKQIFQISPDESYIIQPGQSVVIANCAIDHSSIAEGGVDLSGADFEAKSTNNSYKEFHNAAVPELKLISTFGSADFINMLNPGPTGVVLLAKDTDISLKTYGKGKTTGNEYTVVPMYKSIDCVDIVKQKTPSDADKRFSTDYDAGYTCTASDATYSGQAVVRKTAYVCSDGRVVLFDTNNSSVDFESTDDLSLRSYSKTPAGLDETMEITIPESGYLAINPSKPFCGPSNLKFTYVNVTNNAATTDMAYTHFAGNDQLLIAGPWIAVGQPGTYTLQLSTSQGTMKTRTSGMTWCEENEKTLTGSQASRMIYKFHNEKDNVGFKRVDATAEDKYNHATFSDGDRLYYAITTAIADKIAAANGATDNTDLTFIKWHGVTPLEAGIDTGISTVYEDRMSNQPIYNLQGIRQNGLQKGLNIVGGRKILVK